MNIDIILNININYSLRNKYSRYIQKCRTSYLGNKNI
jgi:hypothetical protein